MLRSVMRKIWSRGIRRMESSRLPSMPSTAQRGCVASRARASSGRSGKERSAITGGRTLDQRLPRGSALTDEAGALLPVLSDAFRSMSTTFSPFEEASYCGDPDFGVVRTFAIGWFPPQEKPHPHVDLRLLWNHDRTDMLLNGLNCFIWFRRRHMVRRWRPSDRSRSCACSETADRCAHPLPRT
jgi:hypothetical protein